MINISKEQSERYWAWVYDDDDNKALKELYAFNPKQIRGQYVTVRFFAGKTRISATTGQRIEGTTENTISTALFKYYDIYQMEHEYPEYLV